MNKEKKEFFNKVNWLKLLESIWIVDDKYSVLENFWTQSNSCLFICIFCSDFFIKSFLGC